MKRTGPAISSLVILQSDNHDDLNRCVLLLESTSEELYPEINFIKAGPEQLDFLKSVIKQMEQFQKRGN